MSAETIETTRELEGQITDLRQALNELLELLVKLEHTKDRLRHYEALTSLLVEALLERDVDALEQVAPRLRRLYGLSAGADDAGRDPQRAEENGRLAALVSLVGSGLDRLAPDVAARDLEPGSRRHHFLRVVAARPGLSSSELVTALELDASAVSRVGHEALAAGLVAQRKLGRVAEWRLTPRGGQVLEQVGGLEPVPVDLPEEALEAGIQAAQDLVVKLAAESAPAEETVFAALRSSLAALELDEPEQEQLTSQIFAHTLRRLANIGRDVIKVHEQFEPDIGVGELLIEAKGAPAFDLLELASPSTGVVFEGLSGKSYVVAPDDLGGWVVFGPTRELPRKKDAIICARQLAKSSGARMIVLDTHGNLKESKHYPSVKKEGTTRGKTRR